MPKKFKREWLIWGVLILFAMSVMPGEGTKATDQQAIVETKYICETDEDCPTCIGGGLIKYNETEPSFFGELSYADCLNGKCWLSDTCLIWDCGEVEDCKSVKQTILDNTLAKINQRPGLLFAGILLAIAYFML